MSEKTTALIISWSVQHRGSTVLVEFRMSDKGSNKPVIILLCFSSVPSDRTVSQYEIDSNIIMYSNTQFREPVILYILLYYELCIFLACVIL